METREEGWKLSVEGVREDDATKMRRAAQKQQEADRMAEEIKKSAGK
jgi:hypothetical protein